MDNQDTENWSNYWQGRNAKHGNDALIKAGIEDNDALKSFWADALRPFASSSSVVDLACGAGSVLRIAEQAGFESLTGVDVSQDALDLLTSRIPNAKTICSEVHETGLDADSADIVVSQYGIEYANDKRLQAFQEASRILKLGGSMIFITHIEDGFVHEECVRSSGQAAIVLESGFIENAVESVRILHDRNLFTQPKFDQTMFSLNKSAEKITDWVRTVDHTKPGFAHFTMYMLTGAKNQIINYKNFIGSESVEWLQGMRHEVKAFKGRMDSMRSAAISKSELTDLLKKIVNHDPRMSFSPLDTLSFSDTTKPAAWIIRGQKG